MKVVIDTNVFLVMLSPRSESHWLFAYLLTQKITLCVTTEILKEYEEIIAQKHSTSFARTVLNELMELPNIEFVKPYFKWNLITTDADDNKFVDCAIACNANYITTNDKHFNILKTIDFPKVNVVSVQELKEILKEK